MRDPIGCNGKEARKYLGIQTEHRFETLRRRKIIRALGQDWYAYADLDQAIELLRLERDAPKRPKIEVLDIGKKSGRKVRGEGDQSGDRSAEELLFADQSAGS